MIRQIKLILLCVTICLLQVKCADKYTDENRPYEFGFNIEGEQHRHEKKDENGIIMGEFGFITADGVYHVTVYATDENGGFKILSMKNIRLKPYPTARAGPVRLLEFPTAKLTAPEQTKLPQESHKPDPASPTKSCSHCSIPTTTTTTTSTETSYTFNNDVPQISSISQDPDVLPKYDQNQYNNPQQIANYQTNSQQQEQQQQQNTSDQYEDNKHQQHEITSAQNYPQSSGVNPRENYLKSTHEGNYEESNQNPDAGQYPTYNSNSPGETYPQSGVNRQSKAYEQEKHQQEISHEQFNPAGSQESFPSKKPQLISAQMQIVDKNTDIHYKHPGEKEGLPDGLTKDDMSQLLYTFNYTVGFHGHYEEGYTNGAKQGYYYVSGRNGIRTRVDYVADEHGFRPKITQEVLDLLSDDVPKAESEKDPKYGLKGYEFKWIYYPVDTKRR